MVDAEGNQIGVLSRDAALAKAQELGLDLVEIAPLAKPAVAKIIDFQKFKYLENKKEQAARKNAKEVGTKEVWLSPRIQQHDLETRLRRAEEFLSDGDKVKLNVKFKGREMIHPENGHKVLAQAMLYFGDKATIEREAKFEGRNLTAIIGQSKGTNNAKTEN